MEKVHYNNLEMNEIPIKIWTDDLESKSLTQALNLAKLPFVFHHIALMPDVHLGYGMPIGGVMATKNVIVPNAVGVDIGCGMRAVQTDIPAYDIDSTHIKNIMGLARREIPVGFSHQKKAQDHSIFEHAFEYKIEVINRELDSARKQLGTLGGGNHFIEIQEGSDGLIWLMIHSGSRNFGFKIAKEYHDKAKGLCERWFSDIPHKDLSFLPMDSKEGVEYYDAMTFALEFACANRQLMMKRLVDVVNDVIKTTISYELDVHHNYAAMENHFDSNVLVHRKGAIRARRGDIGIIPGSQGSKSYITTGLGNPESFNSSSHGAGRVMSRKRAKAELNLEDTIKFLDDMGVVHGIRSIENLDEAPQAYKDIETVMDFQKDLTKINTELTPLGVIKA